MMKQILPKIISSSYKGQNGRLAIIGGCLEYTGAPFYSSISQLKGGCDLAHIFCTKQAAIPIKAYSPEIIVHPYLYSLNEEENPEKYSAQEIQSKLQKSIKLVDDWEGALHSFVIGPGLGRDEWIESYLGDIIAGFKKQQTVVFDADGLWYLMHEYSKQNIYGKIYQSVIVNNPQYHILTPNQVEFERLWKSFMEGSPLKREEREKCMESCIADHFKLELDQPKQIKYAELQYVEIKNLSNPIVKDTVQLSQKLNNINIVQKGMVDVITNGKRAYIVVEKSSKKRCGGIGDILSGLTGLYSYWGKRAFQEKSQNYSSLTSEEASLDEATSILLGCVLASCITRKASYEAYQKHQFSLTAPNVIEHVGPTFMAVYNNFFIESKL
ncbi:hypothetical protein ABPG72_003747 [Tetrahymena utriculariae]